MDRLTEQRDAAWAQKRARESFPGCATSHSVGDVWALLQPNVTLPPDDAIDALRRAWLWLADRGIVASAAPAMRWWTYCHVDGRGGYRFRDCEHPLEPGANDIEVQVETEAPASRVVVAVTIRRADQ